MWNVHGLNSDRTGLALSGVVVLSAGKAAARAATWFPVDSIGSETVTVGYKNVSLIRQCIVLLGFSVVRITIQSPTLKGHFGPGESNMISFFAALYLMVPGFTSWGTTVVVVPVSYGDGLAI